MDFFVDEVRDLSPLLPPTAETLKLLAKSRSSSEKRRRLDLFEGGSERNPVAPKVPVAKKVMTSGLDKIPIENEDELEDYTSVTSAKRVNGKLVYPWEANNRRY